MPERETRHPKISKIYTVVAQGDPEITDALAKVETFFRQLSEESQKFEEAQATIEEPAELNHPAFQRTYRELHSRKPLIALRAGIEEDIRQQRNKSTSVPDVKPPVSRTAKRRSARFVKSAITHEEPTTEAKKTEDLTVGRVPKVRKAPIEIIAILPTEEGSDEALIYQASVPQGEQPPQGPQLDERSSLDAILKPTKLPLVSLRDILEDIPTIGSDKKRKATQQRRAKQEDKLSAPPSGFVAEADVVNSFPQVAPYRVTTLLSGVEEIIIGKNTFYNEKKLAQAVVLWEIRERQKRTKRKGKKQHPPPKQKSVSPKWSDIDRRTGILEEARRAYEELGTLTTIALKRNGHSGLDRRIRQYFEDGISEVRILINLEHTEPQRIEWQHMESPGEFIFTTVTNYIETHDGLFGSTDLERILSEVGIDRNGVNKYYPVSDRRFTGYTQLQKDLALPQQRKRVSWERMKEEERNDKLEELARGFLKDKIPLVSQAIDPHNSTFVRTVRQYYTRGSGGLAGLREVVGAAETVKKRQDWQSEPDIPAAIRAKVKENRRAHNGELKIKNLGSGITNAIFKYYPGKWQQLCSDILNEN